MIVDAHIHVGDAIYFGLPLPVDRIMAMADEAGIAKVVASDFRSIWYDMQEGNRELAAMIKQFPGRLYGYVGITSGNFGRFALDEIERGLNDFGMVGVKVYTSEQFPLYDPNMMEVIARVAELGVPLLAHTSPQQTEQVVKQIPNVKLILAHMGNTFDPGRGAWQWAIAVARRYPNVYLETCSSSPTIGFIETAVDAIGPERVLFGTDMPLFDPFTQMAKVLDADLDERAKSLILGGNAARLFGFTA
ncbi:MAG: amidohydrolase family protein [Chloroflexota bacterium]